MTLDDIRKLLVSADPEIRHYFSAVGDRAYSFWEETERLPILSDDVHEDAWRFYVHRFARDEDDAVARRLFDVLDRDERVAVSYTVSADEDGYIHHVYACEGY